MTRNDVRSHHVGHPGRRDDAGARSRTAATSRTGCRMRSTAPTRWRSPRWTWRRQTLTSRRTRSSLVLPMAINEQYIANCLAYPTTLDRSVTDPVVSDIPTLLFLGQLDTQTPISWGRGVAEGLSRSTRGRVEQHGPHRGSHDPKHCAGDIAAAFLDDPTRKPDLTCAQSDDVQAQVRPAGRHARRKRVRDSESREHASPAGAGLHAVREGAGRVHA